MADAPGAAPDRPRRRWHLIGLWALVLGAATNYVLVWSIIRFGPDGWQRSINLGSGRTDAPDFTFRAGGVLHKVLVDRNAWGVESYVRVVDDPDPWFTNKPVKLDAPEPWMVIPATLSEVGVRSTTSRTNAYGLPFICLMSTEGVFIDPTHTTGGWRAPIWSIRTESRGARYELPLMPIWRGFAANTAVFATAWLAAILLVILPLSHATAIAWSALERRMEAAQRGKCIKCGYPRAGLPEPHTPCPECGSRQF